MSFVVSMERCKSRGSRKTGTGVLAAVVVVFAMCGRMLASGGSLALWEIPLAGLDQEIVFPENSDIVLKRVSTRPYSDRVDVTFQVHQQPGHDKVIGMAVRLIGPDSTCLGKKHTYVELDEGEGNRFSVVVPINVQIDDLRKVYLQVEVLRVYVSGQEADAFRDELSRFEIRTFKGASGVSYQAILRDSGKTILRGRADNAEVARQQALGRLILMIKDREAE